MEQTAAVLAVQPRPGKMVNSQSRESLMDRRRGRSTRQSVHRPQLRLRLGHAGHRAPERKDPPAFMHGSTCQWCLYVAAATLKTARNARRRQTRGRAGGRARGGRQIFIPQLVPPPLTVHS